MTGTDDGSRYEVIVVGGGPAGLSAALYATRLSHDTALIDRGGGRAAMMVDTHNVVGVPESVSGKEFIETATGQIEEYGADVLRGFVTDVAPVEDADEPRFGVTTPDATHVADRVVLATGFSDERPEPPLPRTGTGLHYCLHCDAYMFVDQPVYVMGHGDAAVNVATIMLNFTDDVDLLLRGDDPTWSEEAERKLRVHPVDVVEADVASVENGEDGWLEALEFEDGTRREYRGGFAMYGAEYNNDLAVGLGCEVEDDGTLAVGLGCEVEDDGTVAVDDHGRTSVDGVYAVGDLTPGHNQIPVAMGEGANAGIAIHTELREFPRSVDDIETEGTVSPAEVPGISTDLRAAARDFSASDD